MSRVAGVVVALGGALLAAAAAAPWITVRGLSFDLDLLGVSAGGIGTTVSGSDTDAWPVLVGVGAALALAGVAVLAGRRGTALRGLLLVAGTVVVLAGVGLVYYATNLVDIELRDRSRIEREAAELALSSSPEIGLYLIVAAGGLVILGALAASGGGARE